MSLKKIYLLLILITVGCKKIDEISYPTFQIVDINGVEFDNTTDKLEIEADENTIINISFDCSEKGYKELICANKAGQKYGTVSDDGLNGMKQGSVLLTLSNNELLAVNKSSSTITIALYDINQNFYSKNLVYISNK